MKQRETISEAEFSSLVRDIGPLTKGFDLISDHVVITDPIGNIIYANKAVEHNTGYSKDEVLRKNPGDLWGGQMPESFYKDMWQTIRDFKKPFVGKVKNKKKDGTEYWQELRVFPVLDDKGEIKVFIGIEPNVNLAKVKEANRDKFYTEMDRLHEYLLEKTRKMADLEKEVVELRSKLEER